MTSRYDIFESGIPNVIIATGAAWRRDGLGRTIRQPVPGTGLPHVFTPDDMMNGDAPTGNVLIYDDDHYYMGNILAELLAQQGCQVSYVTPAPLVAYWSHYTEGFLHSSFVPLLLCSFALFSSLEVP